MNKTTTEYRAKERAIKALTAIKRIAEKYGIGIWYNGEYGNTHIEIEGTDCSYEIDELHGHWTWAEELGNIINEIEKEL